MVCVCVCGGRAIRKVRRYGGAAWAQDGQWKRSGCSRKGACRTDGCGCTAEVPETGMETDGRAAGRGYDATLTQEEVRCGHTLRLIRDGVVPDGMSVQGCRYVARTRLGVEFRRKATGRESRWRERALEVMVLKESGLQVKDIAERLGVSHQCVSALLKKGGGSG